MRPTRSVTSAVLSRFVSFAARVRSAAALRALLCLLACFATISAAEPRRAEAACSTPLPSFSPPSRATVPARGVIYLFLVGGAARTPAARTYDPSRLLEALQVDGATFTASVVPAMGFSVALRIDYQATAPQIEVRWGSSALPYTARYPVGNVALGRSAVVHVEHARKRMPCWPGNTIDLELESNAIAFRLLWSDGSVDLLPADHRALFGFGAVRDPSRPTLLPLGHVSCLGDNLPPAQLATERSFQLIALYADGSSHIFPPATAMLRGRDARLPHELLHARARQLDKPYQPTLSATLSFSLLGATLLFASIAALALLLLRRRWYRSALHSPH